MSSSETYSCSRLYHLYDSDKVRDVYYRESVEKWSNCTHARCPLRYNTKEVPNIAHSPALIKTKVSQEKEIKKSHGQQPALVKNPLPAGSTSRIISPRVVSGSFPTSRVGTPRLQESESPRELDPPLQEKGREIEPPEKKDSDFEEDNFQTTVEVPHLEEEETIRTKVEVPEPKAEEESSRSTTPEFIRKSVPSYMSGTITATGESISGAHRYAFTPRTTFGGGTFGSSSSGPAPRATSFFGGMVNPSGGRGGGGPSRPGGRPDPEPSDGGGPQSPYPPGGGGPPGQGPDPDPPGQPGNPQGNNMPQEQRQGKGKIKDPEVFTGDRNKTRSFLNQLFLLFTARPHDFVNDYTKVVTALFFMEGDNINYWKDITIQRAEEEIRPGEFRGFDSWAVFKRNFLLAFAPVDEVDDSMVNLTTIQLKDYSSVDEFNA